MASSALPVAMYGLCGGIDDGCDDDCDGGGDDDDASELFVFGDCADPEGAFQTLAQSTEYTVRVCVFLSSANFTNRVISSPGGGTALALVNFQITTEWSSEQEAMKFPSFGSKDASHTVLV